MNKALWLGVAAAVGCLVVSIALAVLVDVRLDRQWPVRIAMQCPSLLCAVVFAIRTRRSTRVIGVAGIVIWGLAAPLSLTTSASPPEADFALAVHDDARAA